METELLAFCASAIGICGFLPQVFKILKTKNTDAISYSTYCMIFFAGLLWIAYGITMTTYSIVLWNIFAVGLAVTILALKYQNENGPIAIRVNYKHFALPAMVLISVFLI